MYVLHTQKKNATTGVEYPPSPCLLFILVTGTCLLLSCGFCSNDGYNVANSEYQRFSNLLARFEVEKMVGTSKAKDSLQVCIYYSKY